ncbi:GNAT family N-acetyltransferase [Paenibacillus sp. ISL-20]|uniref:GNAT family N-acetyltransferase n=1 Tax=Paenibacillus sp. ISL-20 TaxID=2819163 RepID=UPI001BE73572|nr:GNAT family N-acetyltransferase [Paenibacillus sp. ISL-20]MBT2760103.1 GNAT family N-acetyltransferase [Paenibacillus sp. ISL-20]
MLTTKRCLLSIIQESDYENVKRLYINEHVRSYLGGTTDDEQSLRIKYFEIINKSNEDSSSYWIVKMSESKEFIGLISLDEYYDGGNIEVSYQFLPEYWGVGLATEVISRLIEYAFNELGIQKLVAETQTANIRSCKLLEKVGMIMEKRIIRFGAEQAVYSIQRL